MSQEIVPGIAEDIRPEWKEAADGWRLPFWDWGVTTSVPDLCKYPYIFVPTSDGTGEENIPNPLFQFRMPNNQPMSSVGVDNFKDPWVDNGDTLYVCLKSTRLGIYSNCVSSVNVLELPVGLMRVRVPLVLIRGSTVW
jgi:hypothetical protein